MLHQVSFATLQAMLATAYELAEHHCQWRLLEAAEKSGHILN